MKKDVGLGERIALLRKEQKLRQKEAASLIGIKFATYAKYEYGSYPSRDNLEKIIRFYDCSKSWLLTGEGEAYPEDVTDKHTHLLMTDITDEVNEYDIQRLSMRFVADAIEEFLKGRPDDPFWQVLYWILNERGDRGTLHTLNRRDYDDLLKKIRSMGEKCPDARIEFKFRDIVYLMNWVEKITTGANQNNDE